MNHRVVAENTYCFLTVFILTLLLLLAAFRPGFLSTIPEDQKHVLICVLLLHRFAGWFCPPLLDIDTINSIHRKDKIRRKKKAHETDTARGKAKRNLSLQVHKCCAICLGEYKIGDIVRWSANPDCPHPFHHDCIVEWLRRNKHCPLCRRDYIRRARVSTLSQGGDAVRAAAASPELAMVYSTSPITLQYSSTATVSSNES